MSITDAVTFLSRNNAAHGLSSLAVGSHVTVFTLHRPSSAHQHGTDPAFLRQALEELVAAGYQFVSLEEVLLNPDGLPAKPLCLTMDDGYANQAQELAPILAEYDTKATFFLISDFVDGIDWPWDEKIAYLVANTAQQGLQGLETFGINETLNLETPAQRNAVKQALQKRGKELPGRDVPAFLTALSRSCELEIPEQAPSGYEALTWDQARDMERAGIRLAPHSCNHYITSKLSEEEARHQFTASWRRLKEELQDPVKIYCYPTGRAQDFSEANERMLASLGYLGAVSCLSSPLRLKQVREQRFHLPRIALPNDLNYVFRYASWVEVIRNLAATR